MKVIGIRYELNDPYICVIANMFSVNENKKEEKKGGNVDSGVESIENAQQYNDDVMDINIDDSNFLTDI